MGLIPKSNSPLRGATQSMYGSKITGTGSAFPETIMTNNELAKKVAKLGVETNDAWIRSRTGVAERRVLDPNNPKERNSSLGTKAAQQAMEMAGVKANEIDQILYATCTPDTLLPSTACWVQKNLGADKAWAVDLNAACSGWIYALATADQFIRSGTVQKTLVIGTDTLTPFLNWEDRTSCIIFGDGSGAVVVERTESDDPNRILSAHLRSDGQLAELLTIPGGGSALPNSAQVMAEHQDKIHMKGKEIFKIAVKTLAEFAFSALEKNNISADGVDWFIPHQANLRIIEAVAKRMNFPMERVLVNVDRFANTSGATLPTVLDEAVRDGRIKKGQTLLLDTFGAGLTYGSILMRWGI